MNRGPTPAARRSIAILVTLLILGLSLVMSIAFGSNQLDPATVWRVLLQPDGSVPAMIVTEQRLPRTLLLVVVGAALGVAGALMQSLTRNPLADPGVLGVNAGASLGVVAAVTIWHATQVWSYLWFGFAGAAIAAFAVHRLASAGRRGPDPVRLALAGVAVSMAVSSWVQTILLADQDAYNEFRFWAAGSVENRGYPVLQAISGFVLAGLVLAFALSGALNALALGEDTGRSLGVRVGLTRALVLIAVTVLAGAATAAAGPLLFAGLAAPFLARAIGGPDQRWVIGYTALAAPVMLLVADVVARVVIAPQEVPVGVTVALLGGPVFIAIVRRRRIEAL